MRIIRFESSGKIYTGQEVDGGALPIDGDLFGEHKVGGGKLRVDRLLAPLVPTDILCIGLNYREHAAESNSAIPTNPVLFIKASGTLNNPGAAIQVPKRSSMIDYEGE